MDFRTVRMAPQQEQGEEHPLLRGEIALDQEEVRALACLVEKEATTPDYYPLTLNSAIAACNQKTSRDPVVEYAEEQVLGALERLQAKKLVRRITPSEGRVYRWRHIFHEELRLTRQQGAALCVLMLRGPQTAGEIRQRAARLYEFESIAEVEETLESLAGRTLVIRLERRPGEKEPRYAHLLSGEPAETPDAKPRTEPKAALAAQVSALEEQVATLEAELQALRSEFERFREQF